MDAIWKALPYILTWTGISTIVLWVLIRGGFKYRGKDVFTILVVGIVSTAVGFIMNPYTLFEMFILLESLVASAFEGLSRTIANMFTN